MEKEKKDILKKTRSSRACIRDGYQLYTANFRRIFRSTWLIAIIFTVLSTAASALPVLVAPNLLLPGIVLGLIAVILLLTIVNRQLKKQGFFEKTEPQSVMVWMRHVGMVLLVTIICLFFVVILTLLASLPMIIMMAANWESQIGILNGDPNGMPSYVIWLSTGAFLIAGFFQAYVWLSILCPFYLMRASVAQQEKERQEFNSKNNALNTKNNEKILIYRP